VSVRKSKQWGRDGNGVWEGFTVFGVAVFTVAAIYGVVLGLYHLMGG